ncbi:MAG: Txe/YoeB family addiction module toxin [Oscillospiraceae bacterium]|nr:Txe/YoeB family addiction module toxin [Oscillospiraceae bacterium]
MYDIQFTKQAQKDAVNVERAGLKPKAAEIIRTIRSNPYEESQDFEMLKYELKGTCSRRIIRQHRFVYEVLQNTEGLKDANDELYGGIIKVISMWTHYHE